MVQPYKVGHCPICGTHIMVRDSSRKWSSIKSNFRQVDVKFGNGTIVRTIMCSDCFENGFDNEKLLATITHENSQACTEEVASYIKTLGDIKSRSLSKGVQGESIRIRKRAADTGLDKIH